MQSIGSLVVLALPVALAAQQPVTAADYARAERLLAPGVQRLVVGGTVAPNWVPGDRDDRFWYRAETLQGTTAEG